LTVYKVHPMLVLLSILLVLTAIFFTISNVYTSVDAAEVIICSVVLIMAILNFFSLNFRRLEVDEERITVYSIFGKKSVAVNALEEIGVALLRARAVLILADPEKFIFVPSYFKNFGEFTDSLKAKLNTELLGHLAKVDANTIKKKQLTFAMILGVLNIFFIVSAVYNFLNN
jgi:hypothetical protein